MSRRVLEPEPGLRCVVADNPSPMTLDGTRNYLVGRRRAVLVDPGPGDDDQRSRLRRLADGRRIAAVALTHAHPDHAGGAAGLADDLGVPLVASAETLRRLEADGRPVEGGDRVPVAPPRPGSDDATGETAGEEAGGPRPADGGERAGGGADVGPGGLTAVATPGHAADHTSYWWPSRRAVFTGDLVLGSGSAMVGHPDGHMGDYLDSLSRLAGLRPRRIYPGHGDPVDDPVDRLEAYRAHRLEREARVLEAVQEGARTVAEIRDRAYDELPAALEWAADASVRAHLVHLEEQGRDLPEIEGREPLAPGH